MATKVKNTLSSLYETEGSPCGRVSEHPPNKLLTNSVFTTHLDNYNHITDMQPSGCQGSDFSV